MHVAKSLGPLIIVFAAGTAARADTVRLTGGREIQDVRAVEEDGHVRVEFEHGAMTVPKREVVEIVRGPTSRERVRDELARRRLSTGSRWSSAAWTRFVRRRAWT